ncbi:hypothetical protein WJ972_19450 [Achromobacter insuavis]
MAGLRAPAQAFDRQAQTQRYQQWLADFERDLRQLAAVPNPPTPTSSASSPTPWCRHRAR